MSDHPDMDYLSAKLDEFKLIWIEPFREMSVYAADQRLKEMFGDLPKTN